MWTPGTTIRKTTSCISARRRRTTPAAAQITKNKGFNNDALYTDTTIALNPDTGKLVWHYQHMQNDQWDLDWGFERQVLNLKVGGQRCRVVVTGGKLGIFDSWSEDRRVPVLVRHRLAEHRHVIDPKTGYKTTEPELCPGDGQPKFVCPHAGGGQNWMPTAINPESKIMFGLRRVLHGLDSGGPGERGSLTTGVRWELMPHLKRTASTAACRRVNIKTRQTVWTGRHRAPTHERHTRDGRWPGVPGRARPGSRLTTSHGQVLWRARLTDVPNSAPISYEIDGKQYVAVVVGYGGPHTATFPSLVPDITLPAVRSSSIWVFELPQ